MLETLLDLDTHLTALVRDYGTWTYAILFLIILAETGFVVTPFLPGDSLLFAVGTLAARGALDVTTAIVLLSIAAILGDSINYAIGRRFGHWILERGQGRFIRQEHVDRTHRFYEKHGAKTIVLARFVPIVRTFAPFVAGLGEMTYRRFATYNVVGGIAWVVMATLAGYWFGALPVVAEHFELVVVGIVVISVLPMAYELLAARLRPSPADL